MAGDFPSRMESLSSKNVTQLGLATKEAAIGLTHGRWYGIGRADGHSCCCAFARALNETPNGARKGPTTRNASSARGWRTAYT